MFRIYDASVETPTTLEGVSEYMRIALRDKTVMYATVKMKVFRQNRLTKVWEPKKLYVTADRHMFAPTMVFHLSVVQTTKFEDGEEVDVFYKRMFMLQNLDGLGSELFDKHGYPSKRGWRKALRALNLRMRMTPAIAKHERRAAKPVSIR